jgi:hypothetical protein
MDVQKKMGFVLAFQNSGS